MDDNLFLLIECIYTVHIFVAMNLHFHEKLWYCIELYKMRGENCSQLLYVQDALANFYSMLT